MHRSRDTAHAQWLKTHFQCYPMGDIMSHNSGTYKRRIVKLRGGVEHVTSYGWLPTEVKRSKVKVTSQGYKAENGVLVKPSPCERPLIVIVAPWKLHSE